MSTSSAPTPTPTPALEPLEPRAEWRARDIADRALWTYRLTGADIAELDAALAHARARCPDVLDITREDFPLPTLAATLERFEDELIDGRGFQLISGLPVERYGDADACRIYWGIGMHLGRPWPQNKHGHLLGDVTDQGRYASDPTARGNELGPIGMPYHSDGSDLVGLMCLRKAKSGGISTVANALLAHNEMVRTRPDLAAVLYQPMIYDLRGEEQPGHAPTYEMPVFSRHRHRLFVRYIRPYIESARRHPGVPAITAVQREAFDLLDRMCRDPDFNVYMDLQPGDMQFINNYHVLHARTAFEDYPEPGRKRFLKRLWLETRKLTERPPHLELRGAKAWWGRQRTKAS
ncbi:MAG: TauD/TfdA family dioxygenase [Deltaproteobacteria bacterium]|nr:MAG: TauD/TfdA family dioxygenase [Deltaproteobacteria bacterium]TMQ25226.1 MAG: TauD/TfdA family dioxygenase [Deltaproteobacteria bacterium]